MPGVKGRSGGHNAKTPEAHRLAGSFKSERHSGYQGPKVVKGTPTAPKPLEAEAKAEWDRMVARLEVSGTVSTVDDAALFQYCRLFEETELIGHAKESNQVAIDRAEENLGDFEGEDFLKLIGEITQLRKLDAKFTDQLRAGRMALRQYLVEFGLTPASRGRVKLPDLGEQQDEWTAFDGSVQ